MIYAPIISLPVPRRVEIQLWWEVGNVLEVLYEGSLPEIRIHLENRMQDWGGLCPLMSC